MLATWQSQVKLADECLAEIADGRAHRPYAHYEIDQIKAERARFQAMIDAFSTEGAP